MVNSEAHSSEEVEEIKILFSCYTFFMVNSEAHSSVEVILLDE
jgi:hypothetical protein